MAFDWRAMGLGRWVWAGVDTAPDGRLLAVSVKLPRRGRGKPVVLRCAESSGVAIGEHALQELAAQIGSAQWTVPLARGDYQMLVVPEPTVPDSEMEESLRWTLASKLDFPLEQAVIAWMRIPRSGAGERDRQLYVIVARKAQVDEHAALFDKAQLTLDAVDVRETALRNIASLLERDQEGLGLVTVGPAGVTSTFTWRGELYLDRFFGQPLPDLVLGDEARRQKFYERVAQQVQQSMDLIGRNYPFVHIGRIVVAPTPQPLELAAHLRGKLPVAVELLDLAAVLDLTAAPQLRQPDHQARYLVPLGAALRARKAA